MSDNMDAPSCEEHGLIECHKCTEEALPNRAKHNHFTRDIKAFGKCPACDQTRMMSMTDSEKRQAVLRAAVEFADMEMLSVSVAAPAAGLYEAKGHLLAMVRNLIGVHPGRSREYGHISYRMMKYKEENFK